MFGLKIYKCRLYNLFMATSRYTSEEIKKQAEELVSRAKHKGGYKDSSDRAVAGDNYHEASRLYEQIGDFNNALHYEVLSGSNKGRLFPKIYTTSKAAEKGEEDRQQRLELLRAKIKAGKGDLTSRVSSVIAIAGILGGLFFLSSNITGNAIADMSTQNSSIFGAGLFIIGLVAGFVWLNIDKN